jgi:hypothetical protein
MIEHLLGMATPCVQRPPPQHHKNKTNNNKAIKSSSGNSLSIHGASGM